MRIESSFGDASAYCDLIHARAREAVPVKQRIGALDDKIALILFSLLRSSRPHTSRLKRNLRET